MFCHQEKKAGDVDGLTTITTSEAVQLASYEFIELTLDNEALMTWPWLVVRVSNLCGRRKGIRVLVIPILP